MLYKKITLTCCKKLILITILISLLSTGCAYYKTKKFEVLENKWGYKSDNFQVFENKDIMINYDNANWGQDSSIHFSNESEKEILIKSVECKQYYKGNEITIEQEVEFRKNQNLPLKLCKNSGDISCRTLMINYNTNSKMNDYKIGDLITVYIDLSFEIDGKEFRVKKKLLKRCHILQGFYTP